jgi:hypothetical protein
VLGALLPSSAAAVPFGTSFIRQGGSCAWTVFADSRAILHAGSVFSACITNEGAGTVERYDLRTDVGRTATLFEGLEVDDHNNPSLVVFHGRLFAFWAPHSGYIYPRDRRFFVRFRRVRPTASGGMRLGPVRQVRGLGRGCGLGYTYPSPVVSGRRLFVFMRGPCWKPYFVSTADGDHWSRPRTLIDAPRGRKMRPYAKYSPGPDGAIEMAFADGNPDAYRTSLYYVRMAHGRFWSADGVELGTVSDLPLPLDLLDRVAPFSRASGRAWPEDVAVDGLGRPVIAYSALVGRRDDRYRYARWDGSAWQQTEIAPSGRGIGTYHSAGLALDHHDPARVVFAGRFDGQEEIRVGETTDAGHSWRVTTITWQSKHSNLRPVFPLGSDGRTIVWFSGRYRDWHHFHTRLRMLVQGA